VELGLKAKGGRRFPDVKLARGTAKWHIEEGNPGLLVEYCGDFARTKL